MRCMGIAAQPGVLVRRGNTVSLLLPASAEKAALRLPTNRPSLLSILNYLANLEAQSSLAKVCDPCVRTHQR